MDTTLDILTKLSFESNDEELKRVNGLLETQTNLVRELRAKMDQLDAERKKAFGAGATSDNRELNAELTKTANAYLKAQEQLKLVTAQQRDQAKIVADLQAKNKALADQMKSPAPREEVEKTKKALADTGKEIDKNTSAGERNVQMFKRIGEAIAIAFAAEKIREFGAGAIDEFNQAEAASNRLRLTLKNFGREEFFGELDDQATKLAGRFKNLDNDDIKNAQAKLVTYGKVSINQIKQLLPVIIDFAAQQGESIDGATETIIRGLEGQGKAFKQIGVTFADGNNTAKNFEKITTEVFAKVKGAAADFLNTDAGKESAFKQEIRDLQEELGGKLSKSVLAAKESIKDFVLFLGRAAIFLIENRNAVFALVGVYAGYQLLLAGINLRIALNTEGTAVNTVAQYANSAATAVGNTIRLTYRATLVLMGLAMDVLTGKINLATAAELYFGLGAKAATAGILGIVGVIGTVVALVVLFASKTDSATAATKRLNAAIENQNEIQKRVTESTSEQIARVQALLEIAKNEKLSIDDRKEALSQLNDINKEYLGTLTLQNLKTQEGIDIVDRYIKAIQRLAYAQASQQLLVDLNKKEIEATAGLPLLGKASQQQQQNNVGRFYQPNDKSLEFNAAIVERDALRARIAALQDQIKADLSSGRIAAKDLLSGNGNGDQVITKETDGKADKAAKDAESLAKRRLGFLDELKKKEAELQKSRDELNARDERVTVASITRKIEAARNAALTELRILEEKAARQKLLDKDTSAAIGRVRKLIQDNADLQTLKDTADFLRKQKADQDKFNLDLLKSELALQQDISKIKTDSLDERRELIEKETAIQLREAAAQYDEQIKRARDLNLSIYQIEQDRETRLYLIRQSGNQRRLQAELDFINKANADTQKALELQLSEMRIASNREIQELQSRYDRGKLSTYAYNRDLARIRREAQLAQDQAERLALGQQAQKLQSELLSLTYRKAQQDDNKRDGIITADAVITDDDVATIEKRIDEIIEKLQALDQTDRETRKKSTEEKVTAIVGEIQQYGELVQAAVQAADQIVQIEQQKNQRLLDEQQKRVDAAKDIATKGGAVMLKAEQDRLEKLTAANERYTRNARLLNAILVVSQQAVNIAQAVGAVVNAAATGDPYTTAFRVIAAVAALAGGIAAATSAIQNVNTTANTGYFKGGYTGDGDAHEEAGPVHRREYVFDHKSTSRVGIDTLEKLRSGKIKPVVIANEMHLMDANLSPMNHAAMIRENNTSRQFTNTAGNASVAMDTRRLEKRMDAMIDHLAALGMHVSLDADGFSASLTTHIAEQQKIEKLRS